MIYVRELASDDAPLIERIESVVHPQVLVDGAAKHNEYMNAAVAAGVNLSYGLFNDDDLVGYLLCYGFEPTAFSDEQGEAIYIEDIVVLPRYRRMLPKLIKRFLTDVRRHFPGAALEAHSVRSVFEIWRQHDAYMTRHGATLVRHCDTGEVINSEARLLIRWQSVVNHNASTENLDNLLASLPDHDIMLDGQAYTLKVVRDDSQWEALAPLWDELLLATPDHTVFQSYRYQHLWWRHFGGDAELRIIVIMRDGKVRGIAPLQIQTAQRGARYFRQLGFIGSRWEVDRPTFFFPHDSTTLLRVLVRFLVQDADAWDFCDFHEQPIGSASLQTLRTAFRAEGYLVGEMRDSDCAYLAIQGSWQEFLAAKSSLFRKNLKTAGRRLRALGDFQYRVYTAPSDVLEQLEQYRDIEARSWKSAEGVGVSRNDGYFEFYRELAALFSRHGDFVVRTLTVDGKAVAGTFGLRYDGVFYSLQIAHDKDVSRCSPGTYLEALEMEQCFDEGYREYEFLGGFLNNKSRWTSTFRHTTQLFVYRRTPYFLAHSLFAFQIKPWLKAIKQRVVKPRHPSSASVAADHD